MNNTVYELMADYFKILSHPTRIKIIEVLSQKEMCVCEMMAEFNLDQSHISRHLMLLRAEKIITDTRVGNKIYYALTNKDILNIVTQTKKIIE